MAAARSEPANIRLQSFDYLRTFSFAFNGPRHFYTTVLIGLGMVALLLPLTFVLIPKNGPMGAAWSFAISVTIGTTLRRF